MLTFTKLLEIRIVASNLLGLSNNLSMASSFFPFLSFNDSISEGDKEKNAVSEPETIPENITRITNITRPITVSGVKPIKNCSDTVFTPAKRGSGSASSKICNYVNTNLGQNY